ncbi:chemotaxis response regulator protein-glutamate methylesterase [Priestia megaterium]|nr:chemotaxis response regulator protein-glutamate methylesterase [Priestia megaterium]
MKENRCVENNESHALLLKRGEKMKRQHTQIGVMIVEDSILQRAMIRSMLERDRDKRFIVVASANNGKDALEKLVRHHHEIDVITMDIEMPVMTGLEALKIIMESYPKPTLMFSSLTNKGTREAIQALSMGATDFIAKPTTGQVKDLESELIEKVYYASQVKITNPSLSHGFSKTSPQIKPKKKEKPSTLTNIILIGTSTGGPRTLTKLMSQLPENLQAGIVIVQHMQPGGFTASFANSLNQISAFEVKEAEDGDELLDGRAFVAPAGLQTEVFLRHNSFRLVLSDKHLEFRHKPSVDVLFSSLARINPNMHTFGVILTGMGDDGCKGSQALKRIKSTVIAESEKTAILYGMPKQVAKRGLADYIEDLDNVIPRIQSIIKPT